MVRVVWAITHSDDFFQDGQLLPGPLEAGFLTLGQLFASGALTPRL